MAEKAEWTVVVEENIENQNRKGAGKRVQAYKKSTDPNSKCRISISEYWPNQDDPTKTQYSKYPIRFDLSDIGTLNKILKKIWEETRD